MQNKEVKELQYWQLFQKEKDFKDIQAYVWKEYDVFKVFYESIHTKIKDKIKLLDQETQEVINNYNSTLGEKVFQKNLREYIKSLF